MKPSLEAAVNHVLGHHVKVAFCCYADRAPCVLDIEDFARRCGQDTCLVCAPSPRNGHTPVWPCSPRRLAIALCEHDMTETTPCRKCGATLQELKSD